MARAITETSFISSERAECGAERDHCDECDDRAGDGRHHNIEIALTMGRAAHREQSHDGTILRQAVERSGAHYGDAM
jgi:hypothetical protein